MSVWKSSGLRVIELGGGISAAFAARLLADFGADVIKVEDPSGPDVTRAAWPFGPGDIQRRHGGLFRYLNSGKRGVTIDASTSTGARSLVDLLAEADVVIENLGAGRFDRLL
ncbi:MAG: CoA transferase, partial [Tepidiformaceae bacterium]